MVRPLPRHVHRSGARHFLIVLQSLNTPDSMPQDDVATLEAALDFISQYELSSSPLDASAVDITPAFEHSHMLRKAHSLEIPEPVDTELHEFLDDFKVETELFDSEPQQLNVTVKPELNSTPRAATPRRRASKREEIIGLRDTVAELTQQLDQLQASSAPNSPAEEDVHVGSILAQPESLWQQVATRQLVLRQKAEEANAHLRSLVENRVRETKNLKRMLSRRSDPETLELVGLKRRKQMYTTGPSPKDNDDVFAELLQGTDELYVGLDKLFRDTGMAQVPCPGRRRQVQRDAVNGALVMFLDKNQVPFELRKTEKAVWKLLTGRHRKDGPYIQGAIDWESQESGDTVTNYVSFTCVAGDVTALLHVREVARKYITENQATFICRSVMEPTPTGESGAIGLKFHETMTVVVKRGEPLSSGQETSIIESYLCATRHDEGATSARKFRGQVYVDIAIEGWESTLVSNNQDIENLLFDEAVRVG